MIEPHLGQCIFIQVNRLLIPLVVITLTIVVVLLVLPIMLSRVGLGENLLQSRHGDTLSLFSNIRSILSVLDGLKRGQEGYLGLLQEKVGV